MKTNARFLFVILCLHATTAWAATVAVPIAFNTATGDLQGPKSPKAAIGDDIRIEIAGVSTHTSSTWEFTLSGKKMNPATMNGGVAFIQTVQTGDSNPVITMSDSTGKASLVEDILIDTGSKGGGGDRMQSDVAKALVETDFRNSNDRENDIVNLYFDTAGLVAHGDIPRDVDDNDAIRVYVVGRGTEVQAIELEVEGKFSAGDDFNSLGSGSLADVKNLTGKLQSLNRSESQVSIFNFGTYGPFAAPNITIKISKKEGATKTLLRQYPVRINKTYLAAYRLLAGRSDIRFNDFKANAQPGKDGKFIENVSNESGDTRYFLTLVPYAWQFWKKSNWRGRDVAEPPTLLDRFNPVIGVGLKDPGKEFIGGISFEVARGLDVVWGWHRANVKTLSGGFKEGDAFTGETIPVRQKAETEHIFGISLDLRVATQLLSSLF